MKPLREYVLRVLLELQQMAFVLAGYFVLGCLLVILGFVIYFCLEEPRRTAADRATFLAVSPTKTNVVLMTYTIIAPQPLQLKLGEKNVRLIHPPLEADLSDVDTNAEFWVKTNMVLINPPLEAYLSGAASNAAIWANGKAFRSGGRAAWELARGAWGLWLLGAGTLTCGLLLRRYFSAQKPRCELIINIPEAGASPNAGTTLTVVNGCFCKFPQTRFWHEVHEHLAELPGVAVTDATDVPVVGSWIDFTFREHSFTINAECGEFVFFVEDTNCPESVREEVTAHFVPFFGAPTAKGDSGGFTPART